MDLPSSPPPVILRLAYTRPYLYQAVLMVQETRWPAVARDAFRIILRVFFGGFAIASIVMLFNMGTSIFASTAPGSLSSGTQLLMYSMLSIGVAAGLGLTILRQEGWRVCRSMEEASTYDYVTISDEGISGNSPHGSGQRMWSGILRAYGTRQGVVLMVGPMVGMWYPWCVVGEQREALIDLIHRHLPPDAIEGLPDNTPRRRIAIRSPR